MKTKKILWLSNFRFSKSKSNGSGTWIEAMGFGMLSHKEYEIYNITIGSADSPTKEVVNGITQWTIPIKELVRRNLISLPSAAVIDFIVRTVNDISPDLIHVWGSERFWGLLTARKILNYPALLEMQGIPSAMTPYLAGCLTEKEIASCNGIKEMLRPELSIKAQQEQYKSSEKLEREIWAGHKFIDYQSDWVKAYILPWVESAKLYKTRMLLRRDFVESIPWEYKPGNHVVFTTCGWSANKGLHTLVRACGLLKRIFPDITLRIAGHFQSGIRRNGYTKWVMKEIERQQINAIYLDALCPNEIIQEMHKAAVFVNPSFIESYSISLAEGMAVGCPCVASYTGAMPEVGGDACLYFPIGDIGLCAERIRHVFDCGERISDLSRRSRLRSMDMHNIGAGISRQCEIYDDVLASL